MEDLCGEPAFWWRGREFTGKTEFDLEVTSGVWCALRSFNNPGDIEHIILVRDDANSLWWICSELIELLHKPTKYCRRDGHDEETKLRENGDVEVERVG